jgi:hypothetical protein
VTTIVKEVQLELTPTDIVRAIRALSREEHDELILEIQRLLIEQDTDVLDLVPFVLLPGAAEPEPRPELPPDTPEGDREALAAVDDFCEMFPISDLELARWIAESEEAGLFGGS